MVSAVLVSALKIIESFYAYGHPNVLAKHPTTFEITKDYHLSKRGDCVLAVRAAKGLADFSQRFKELCRNDSARITVEFKVGRIMETIEGRGCQALTFDHLSEMVGRKSTYVSDRTLLVRADRAACDVNRDLIRALKSPNMSVQIRLIGQL